jgi:hypothetical protein
MKIGADAESRTDRSVRVPKGSRETRGAWAVFSPPAHVPALTRRLLAQAGRQHRL